MKGKNKTDQIIQTYADLESGDRLAELVKSEVFHIKKVCKSHDWSITFVVDFDQRTGAPHTVCWTKSNKKNSNLTIFN